LRRYDTNVAYGGEEYRMHPWRRTMRRALGLVMLAALGIVALAACGQNEKEANPRPLPEDDKTLQPGEYRSEEFEPSLSFKVGKGWSSNPLEASDSLFIRRGETMGLGFVKPQEVYKPTKDEALQIVDAPKDLVGWFQHHRHLQTDKPEPVTVGGVEGEQFDVVVGDLPEDYESVCGSECVGLVRLSTGSQAILGAGDKLRLIVLEDVQGETVTLGFVSPASTFDEYAPKAQKVVDTVKWRDP
jgi:predicted small lipoprotein YifL